MVRNLIICLMLILATGSVYGQVIGFDFFWDDTLYISDNPHIHDGLTGHGFNWAFTARRAANWHPLTWLSHMLDCQLYGLEPSGHHVTNVHCHILNALLLLAVLRRATGNLWPSVFAAALFALHPLTSSLSPGSRSARMCSARRLA